MNKRAKEVTSILLAASMIFSSGTKQKQVATLPPEQVKIEEVKEVKKLKKK